MTVVENPVISRIAFEGNKKVKDEQLSAEVQSKPRGTLSRPMVQSDAQRITEIYRRPGRYDVRVDPQIIEQPNNRVDLIFEITEGSKTGVTLDRVRRQQSPIRPIACATSSRRAKSNILSFLGGADIYDPDRVEADRDLIRRYYLKNGYADVQVVAALTEYDPEKQGIPGHLQDRRGPAVPRRVRSISRPSIRALDANAFRSFLRVGVGSVYNAEAIEKSVEEMQIEASRRGYAFAGVRPRGDRNFQKHTVSITFAVEEGPRIYIERINIRGNTRTRDYVIRREFDISEGDAYNRALIDRAERRLKNLDYFKTVKIVTEPGSSSDRVIVIVDLEEKSTGDFSVSGGYSTTDGSSPKSASPNATSSAAVSMPRRRCPTASAPAANAVVRRAVSARTIASRLVSICSSASSCQQLYLLRDQDDRLRPAAGLRAARRPVAADALFDLPAGDRAARPAGATVTTILANGVAGVQSDAGLTCGRYGDRQSRFDASLRHRPVVLRRRRSLAAGAQGTASGKTLTSAVGYSLTYNTLDNNKDPTDGLLVEFRQDFAGLGGDVNYLKTAIDARYYLPLVVRRRRHCSAAGRHHERSAATCACWITSRWVRTWFAALRRTASVRATSTRSARQDALGGTKYWGASVELQMPFWFLPKEVGLKGAVYADAGGSVDYKGPTAWVAPAKSTRPVASPVDHRSACRYLYSACSMRTATSSAPRSAPA